ncbi:hypothetical protein AA15669_1567 [Saccharibacter floricola DSM 15669]|uniref:Uncharacterized protein n=2 Tax=Saccharibacter TaxID=231052 RepID=A0ABQ0P086_9PROT|nr:hypothetical protein AA15669_1567 [Saccharibacter floricola DSM 15669]
MPIVRVNQALSHAIKSTEGDTLSPEDANAQYGIKGVLNFDQPVSSKLADTLHREKQNALLRDMAMRNGPSGVVSSTLNMGAGALPSLLDPINAASMLVPGLGEERVTAGLGMAAARAEGWGMERAADGLLVLKQRTGPQALFLGPPERAASCKAPAKEPLNLYLDRDEHNDWTMGQALSNIAFGSLMGGALHSLARPELRATDPSVEPPSPPAESEEPPEQPPPNPTEDRLRTVGPDGRGQVLAESLTSLNNDRPSNADSLLHLHELETTRRDLDRWMDAHKSAPPQQGRGTLENDLAHLHQKHADLLDEQASFDPQSSPEKATPPPSASRPKAEPSSPSLFTFLTKHGGVRDEGGELRANDIHKQRIGLVRRNGGLSFDRARELSEEAGYLKPGADINDLLNAMTEESHGRKSYANGVGPQKAAIVDPAYEDHARAAAHDDVEVAAYDHDKPLSEDVHAHAAEATLQGADPYDALEDALKASSHHDWDQYRAQFDKSRSVHQARIAAKKDALHALTEHHFGRYAQRLESGVHAEDLTILADTVLKSPDPEQAIEQALNHLEANRGQGFDPRWQDTLHAIYQQALQKLSDLQDGVGTDILHALTNPESREITQSRAGLKAHREAAPTPETGDAVSPLPTTGIDHLNLSEVGEHPALMGHMPDGIEGVPPWPVVIGDGEHLSKITKNGRDIGGGHGRIHIAARHGKEIEQRGFRSVDDYIKHIIKNMNQIRQDLPKGGHDSGSYFSIQMGKDRGGKDKQDTAILHLMKKDGYYRVGTASVFDTKYLEKRKLLWDGSRHNLSRPAEKSTDLPPSSPNKSSSDDVYTSSRHNSFNDGGAQHQPSQDKSLHEAQAYGATLDQKIALYGEKAIPPEALDAVKQEHALSDGNSNALLSATACLIRTRP